MSASSTRFMIIILTLFTALVHLVYLNLGGLQIPFLLNGLGYFALLGALLFKFPPGQERLVHYAFMAFALTTIVAWIVIADPYTLIGYVTKAVEVLLIVFLWMDLQRLPSAKS